MQKPIQLDPNGLYTITLRGVTLVTLLAGLQEVPKRLADPAQEELVTQVAMLSTARAAKAGGE
jgi:hypothetical protein